MSKICPECDSEHEKTELSCQCGFVFLSEIEASQEREAAECRSLRRNRIVKKAAGLSATAATLLVLAAYFGGFFRAQVGADDHVPSRPTVSSPAIEKNKVFSPSLGFPETNVPYTVTKAFTGAAIGVTDANNIERRVTIYGVRVPKLDESFGKESRESLSTMVANRSVTIKVRKVAKEADTIAEVSAEGSNIGLEQVRKGMAWLVAEEIAGLTQLEQWQYLEAAAIAKSGKYGVWSGRNTLEPTITEIAADVPLTANDPRIGGVEVSTRQRPVPRRIGQSEDTVNYVFDPEPSTVAPTVPELEKPSTPDKPAHAKNTEKEPAVTSPAKVEAAPKAERKYIRGPFGGCYYLTAKGNKSYVDRSVCN